MTLMEVVVTLAVVSLVMVSASDAVLSLYRTNGNGTRATAQIANARHGFPALLQELRQSAYGNDGSYPIAVMATSSLTFFSNISNSAGALKLQYQLVGTTLVRSQTNPSTPPAYTATPSISTIATDVHNASDDLPLFRYYDKNGTEITNMSNVTAVASVVVTIDVLSAGMTTPFVLSATTTLRNLRTP